MSIINPKFRKRLGILIPEFPSQTHAFFWREIEAIRERGVEVEIFSTSRPLAGACKHRFADVAAESTHYVFPPTIQAAGTRILISAIGCSRIAQYVLSLRESNLREKCRFFGLALCGAELASIANKLNVGHLHVHSCADAAHVAAVSFLFGGPTYSLHLHGDLAVYGKDHQAKMRHAKFVSVAANPLQLQVRDIASISSERTYTHWMGIDLRRLQTTPGDVTTREIFELITVARLNFTKGHVYALEALTELLQNGINARYTIIGDGPYEDAIKQDIDRLQLSKYVRMIGTVGEDEVAKYLGAADVFVLPSFGKGEASPVSVMEAMAMGLPSVVSRIGGTGDMIDDGVDGYLTEQKKPNEIARRLVELASSPEKRRSMGKLARKRALEQFDVRTTSEKLLNAIEKHSDWRRL